MRAVVIAGLAGLALAGCGGLGGKGAAPAPTGAMLPTPEAVEVSPLMAPGPMSAEALDTTTRAERAEAAAPPVGGEALGTTIASLGDPTEAGFWLRTPLVSAPAKGRVELAGGAVAVAVDLIPLAGEGGAGSQISLSALRMLGLSLTDLPELAVYRF